MSNEKLQAFLTELTELSRKHGISISGCGCCGSPALDEDDRELTYTAEHGGNLTYS